MLINPELRSDLVFNVGFIECRLAGIAPVYHEP